VQALNVGLVHEVVEPDALMVRAHALAADMATKAPVSLQLTKQLVNAATGEDTDVALEAMAGALAASTQDAKEGIASFKEKRAAAYIGR
jgi:enoyl-CoA hydratase/carnithine racemase